MAAYPTVRARIDPHTKSEAEAALAAMGLSTSIVFRALMSHIAAEKSLPFDLFRPTDKTVAAMKAARSGRTVKAGRSAESLIAGLDAD